MPRGHDLVAIPTAYISMLPEILKSEVLDKLRSPVNNALAPADLDKRLEEGAQKHYAIDSGEWNGEVCGTASAFFDANGTPIGALSLMARATENSIANLDNWGVVNARLAAGISHELGHPRSEKT
ncbi:hypothetical protein [Caballeronia sp. J97]|uniref:hypothetical protein n=1 Tax=Caballeronia sp. J97 TaxID=2805429 RepID=UPI002AB20CF6|nr:hypothetical protein [Caballeronia sp. J97]